MMARSHAASMGSRGGPAHKIAARSLRRDRAALSRRHGSDHTDASASVPKSLRRCRCSPSSCSHHLPANLPNARFVRGGEHGNFVRGDEAISSMNGCSLCMYRRCVADVRPIAHDICSTLPARRVDLRRFTRVVLVGRMYLLSAVLERFTRFALGLDGRTETTYDPAPIWSARLCRVGGSRGGYTRMSVSRASRAAEKVPTRALTTELPRVRGLTTCDMMQSAELRSP